MYYVLSRSPSVAQQRWSGLDGLRAIAVTAVVAFHFAPDALPGGFLGVDIFFVLSGYLITRMITTEYLRFGSLRFGNFYLRRARRLLPGLGLLLTAALAAAAFWRDQLTTVRAATAAASGYVSNWWLSFAHQSYFVSAGRPSMLQHLWSLAVEEQFYLLWPLIAVGVLAIAPHRYRAVTLAGVAALLALASTAEMALLAIAHNAPYGTDASRLYYGTDTHSMGLLLGAALGALAAGRAEADGVARGRFVPATDTCATGGLLAIALIMWRVPESSPGLYRGGFLAVAALTAVVAASAARSGSRLGRMLDPKPMRWLAARSYAIYLWHWPVAVVTRPGIDVHWPGWLVLLVRLVTTLLLADLTHRFVELPVRSVGFRLGIRAAARRLTRVMVGQAPVGARLATAAMAALALVAVGVLASGPRATLSDAQKALAAEQGGRDLPLGPPATSGRPLVPAAELVTPAASTSASSSTAATASPGKSRSAPTHAPPVASPNTHELPTISAFGDSVMLGARSWLDRRFPGGTLDAIEGRQPDPILRDVEQDAAAGKLNPVVVIGVGDNGLIDPDALRHALDCLRAAARVDRVIVLNNRVGRYWESSNNRTIASVVPKFHNATVLDWYRVSAPHPGWFYEDGIHLTPSGAVAYTRLIASAARLQ
jgi:peptidoglycan/LPS O-acetylase OafA/YrhL